MYVGSQTLSPSHLWYETVIVALFHTQDKAYIMGSEREQLAGLKVVDAPRRGLAAAAPDEDDLAETAASEAEAMNSTFS